MSRPRSFGARGASQITIERAIEIARSDYGATVEASATQDGAYIVSKGAESYTAFNADEILNGAEYCDNRNRIANRGQS